MDLITAVATLSQAFETVPEYREAWRANIAMCFIDEYERFPGRDYKDAANAAAERFLNLLKPTPVEIEKDDNCRPY